MNNNQEQVGNSQENKSEALKPNLDKSERLSKTPEKSVELSPRDIETRAEKARDEALESAISVESGGKEKSEKKPNSHKGPISKKQRELSYHQTMKHVQDELSITSRTFSKVIHNKYVERTSEVIGNSIARPNAMFAGAFMAFLLTLLTYTIAKTIGYNLSGFETIASFIIGWLIGITYDYFKVLFTGKK